MTEAREKCIQAEIERLNSVLEYKYMVAYIDTSDNKLIIRPLHLSKEKEGAIQMLKREKEKIWRSDGDEEHLLKMYKLKVLKIVNEAIK